jgi:hypothetical protein
MVAWTRRSQPIRPWRRTRSHARALLPAEDATHLTDIAWSEEETRGVRIGVLFALGEVLEAQHKFDEASPRFVRPTAYADCRSWNATAIPINQES